MPENQLITRQLITRQILIISNLQQVLLNSMGRALESDLYSDRLSEYARAIESACNGLAALRSDGHESN